MIKRSNPEIIDFSEYEKETISYCKHCEKFGFSVPLRNRIYPNTEPIPADHENYKQCHECGTIVPIYELEKEASIKDVVEPVENPFDIGTSFLGVDNRTSIRGKNTRKKKESQRELDNIKDEDLKSELKSGQTQLISYTESQRV